ncbi:hypothetical protein F5876DRAFT_81332 [Lentinula aff. lateritia]|uniref:Uncharacterized protein n=1 Tax=Lentinula aff. lateritia TaxID=2804960 RepID=A0ACC1TM69_9AGAR|nr:hypothetical protein F5876DRAFT_81332 [Lentinula aff. lateritia]
MPDLPQELVDRFIDEFSHSIDDLKNLALVSKSWLHRARYHIFRCVTLAPQDRKEISEYYVYLERKATATRRHYYHHPLSFSEQRLLHSPLFGDLQPQALFISSIRDALHLVRGLRLESFIRVGRGRRISPQEYFHQWLGFWGRETIKESILMRDLFVDDEYHQRQRSRWNDVDLPWGHRAGLHALPFRCLRYLQIRWSVFSWIPPPVVLEEDFPVVHMNPTQWPGYQLAMLFKANANTLDHVSIDEYPGFQLEKYSSTHISDALLDLLAKNVPKLISLFLGGPMQRADAIPIPEMSFDLPQPTEPDALLARDRPLYPSGEEVPYVYPNPTIASSNELNHLPMSLDRVSVRGFDSQSTLLVEDAFLNSGVLSTTRYIALSSMPENFNYMFFLSRLSQSLTHLTLDLDKTTLHLKLRFHCFPNLACLQLMINSIRSTATLRNMVGCLLNDDASELDEPMTATPTVRLLHLSFGCELPELVRQYLMASAVDDLLRILVQPMSSESDKSIRRTKVDEITMDLPINTIADSLPMTFQTGSLNSGKTDVWWWCRPTYL